MRCDQHEPDQADVRKASRGRLASSMLLPRLTAVRLEFPAVDRRRWLGAGSCRHSGAIRPWAVSANSSSSSRQAGLIEHGHAQARGLAELGAGLRPPATRSLVLLLTSCSPFPPPPRSNSWAWLAAEAGQWLPVSTKVWPLQRLAGFPQPAPYARAARQGDPLRPASPSSSASRARLGGGGEPLAQGSAISAPMPKRGDRFLVAQAAAVAQLVGGQTAAPELCFHRSHVVDAKGQKAGRCQGCCLEASRAAATSRLRSRPSLQAGEQGGIEA